MTSPDPHRLPPALGSLRAVTDGASAALLRRDGEVVWWCLPELDADPALWSLLDAEGPAARWRAARTVDSEPTPAAPALRTVIRTPCGRLECLDGLLPHPGEGAVLVRLVRALDDALDVVHELTAGGRTWDGRTTPLHVRPDTGPLLVGDAATSVRLTAPRNTWRCLLVGTADLPGLSVQDAHDALAAARAEQEQRLSEAHLPSLHPGRTLDALRVLHACTVRATGAVSASLTTSLPEAIPGDRQWDYRACWLRDSSLAVSVASLVGAHDSADRFLRFACAALGDDPLHAAPVFALSGGEVGQERTVDDVAGWAGVGPVRVGNDAGGQVQHDALGLYVEAVSVHVQTGGALDDGTWQAVRRIADGLAALVLDGPAEPSSGIWELREPRRLVSEDVGRWLALDRALWVARGWRPTTRRRHWKRARAVLRARVLAATRPDGTLPLDHDDPTGPTDASALMVALFGLQDGAAGRRLVEATLARLGAGPAVHRYEPAPAPGTDGWDGLHGQEGTFLPVSFMAIGALAAVGLREQAHERLDTLCATLPRLLPEMWDPHDDRGLGNTPLLWSHMELVRALYLLDTADRRQRLGRVGLGLWRVARYLRLRRSRADPA